MGPSYRYSSYSTYTKWGTSASSRSDLQVKYKHTLTLSPVHIRGHPAHSVVRRVAQLRFSCCRGSVLSASEKSVRAALYGECTTMAVWLLSEIYVKTATAYTTSSFSDSFTFWHNTLPQCSTSQSLKLLWCWYPSPSFHSSMVTDALWPLY